MGFDLESICYRGGVVAMITRRKEIELDDLYKFANSCSHTFLDRVVGKEMSCKTIEELIQYKKIEEELDIDLLTLIKALKDGIYCYSDNGNDILFERIEHFVPYMAQQLHTRGKLSIIHGVKSEEKEKHFAIKDYGKTWALTKEELE